ncbi:hypothetical protein [Pendulispora albinea]|uniref:Uncharacterized protein n=1 Tax=Pendulispora albinea TaxID=2741071 RepID=A0ABZ2LYZ5_9BACT
MRAVRISLFAAFALVSGGPACGPGAEVDLTINAQPPLLVPGETGVLTLRVGNRGRDAAQGAEVTVVTPFFVNFARPVPAECELRYENLDPFLPEVLICHVDGTIAPSTERELSVPVALVPGGPRGRNYGSAMVLPAAGSRDREMALADNLTAASVVRLRQVGEPPPAGNTVGIYLASNEVPISLGSRTTATLTIGNAGPNATSVPTRVIYRTPFFTNIDADVPLPPGCQMRLTDTAPNVPEIVECGVAAGLKPGEERELGIPLTLVAGGPTGMQLGFGLAAGTGGGPDVDPIGVDNAHPIHVLMLTGPRAESLGPDTPKTALAGQPARLGTPSPPPPADAVDLAVVTDNVAATPGTNIISTFRVTNRGNLTTQSPARLVVVPPFYFNVDRARLPAGCKVVVSNPQANIPEVAECIIPAGMAPGEQRSVDLPLDVLPGGPIGFMTGTMFVDPGENDVEGYIADNISIFGLHRSAVKSPPPREGVDLWVSTDQPALSVNAPRTVTVRYGNVGRRATQGPSELVYVTPFYVNVDRSAPLPAGCRVQEPHPDPLIPEIVLCSIPPGLEPGWERQLTLPIELEPGGPAGMLVGNVSLEPSAGGDAADTEVNFNDNLHHATVIAVRN